MDKWENEKDTSKRAKMYIERYAVELLVITSILISGLNFIVGRSMNSRLAHAWLKAVQKTLIDSFNFIPEDCKEQNVGADNLEIVSFEDSTNSEYPISVAGRESCKYASFNVVTKPRHDIATTIFTQLPFINMLFSA